jgi:hypothetical protein
MSKKKKNTTTHTLRWSDGPLMIEVEGIGDGSRQKHIVTQAKGQHPFAYEPVDLHEFAGSDKPCINYLCSSGGKLNMAVVTAHDPDCGGGELAVNAMASEMFSQLVDREAVIYGNALFIPAPWAYHYPVILKGYVQGLDAGAFSPDEES